MHKNIKNVIFDLGGVIINIDMPLTFKAFAQLAPNKDIPNYTYNYQAPIFKQYEVGAISSAEFRDGLRDLIGEPLTDTQIDDAWNAMLLDIPAQRMDLLLDLKEQYRTFLFSNTNAIHYDAFNKVVESEFGEPTLDKYFERTYYSHIMQQRKPDAASFRTILDDNGLLATETLFLDDTPGHLEGAKTLGIQTELVSPENDILTIFKEVRGTN